MVLLSGRSSDHALPKRFMLLLLATIAFLATSNVALATTFIPTLIVSPNPAIVGQTITFQGQVNPTPRTYLNVRIVIYVGSGCGSTAFDRSFGFTTGPGGLYSLPFTWSLFSSYFSSSPEAYSAQATVVGINGGASSCVNFQVSGVTTTPTVAPAYIPVGGEMLPINRVQVILPWLVLAVIFSVTISIWMLSVNRRRGAESSANPSG